MNKNIFILFTIVSLLTLGFDILISYQFVNQLFQSIDERRLLLDELFEYETYLSELKDAETGQRGFIITNDPDFLEPYYSALDYLKSENVEFFFKQQIKNEKEDQAEKIKHLANLEKKRLDMLKQVITIRESSGFEAAQKVIQSKVGKHYMDEIRSATAELIHHKKQLSNKQDLKIKKISDQVVWILTLGDVISIFFISLCLAYLYRYIKKLEQKERDLSLASQKLRETLATQKAILNATNYGIISVDTNGIITTFNPAAEKMLGYRQEELINKKTPSVFHDLSEMENRTVQLFQQLHKKLEGFDVFVALAKQDIPDTREWTYIRKDGSHFPVLLSISSIKDENGKITGFVGIASDITERKEIERMRNELMAMINHELRSPMAAIKGTIELLFQDEFGLTEKGRHVLELGKKNCDYLIQLTNDIIEIQKIETGAIDFHFKPLNLALFLSQIVQTNNLIANHSQISLKMSSVPNNWVIEADERRLTQVLNNLLSNAIKYSPKGTEVEISTHHIDSKVRIEIADKGPGISKDFQARVFEKFSREPSPLNASKKGSGLGLHIAKSIIEHHQGVIGFKTGPEGTTFWFELPLQHMERE